MTKNFIKRSNFVFAHLTSDKTIDILLLLKGNAMLNEIDKIEIYSVISGKSKIITVNELNILLGIPASNWIDFALLDIDQKDLIDDLIVNGFILKQNSGIEEIDNLLEKENILKNTNWNSLSAFYHFSTKWSDVNLDYDYEITSENANEFKQSPDFLQEYFNKMGFPPTHFYSVKNEKALFLPIKEKKNELYKLLLNRKTTRIFKRNISLKLEDFSTILYYVFGCHGLTKVYEDDREKVYGVKKSSPSGGGLHPTEIYPLVINVEGIDPGLYHYNLETHSLELLRSYSQEEASKLANDFTAGQSYPKWASALFILTTRYFRNYWKYNQHPQAYKVVLMDAAHLSQTFYLVCTDLKIGAFTTAAINAKNIETALNLNGYIEGATLIVGCGIPDEVDLSPDYEKYDISDIIKKRSTMHGEDED